MLHRKLAVGSLLLLFLLAGCFKDASQERQNPTSVPINDFLNITASPSPASNKTLIPTLTATPQREPTNTFPVGGPPIEVTEEAIDENPTESLPPTVAIPSFTPRPGTNFGDSAITPTIDLTSPPPPVGLITPTGFAPENLECVHVVQPNETLFSIATLEGVSVDDMIAVNPALIANPNVLQIGQQLVIPNCVPGQGVVVDEPFGEVPTSSETQAATPASDGSTHTVQAGDTLFRIATQYGVTVDELIAANPALAANPDALAIGQVLTIPTPSQ